MLDLSLYLHSTLCRWPKLPAVLRAVQCLVTARGDSLPLSVVCACGWGVKNTQNVLYTSPPCLKDENASCCFSPTFSGEDLFIIITLNELLLRTDVISLVLLFIFSCYCTFSSAANLEEMREQSWSLSLTITLHNRMIICQMSLDVVHFCRSDTLHWNMLWTLMHP